MRKTAVICAVLFLLAAAAPAALAAAEEAEQTWTLATDGASVSCGTVACLYREEVAGAGLDVYPVLVSAAGDPLPAGQLAATGDRIRYTAGEETVETTLVLMGDVTGSGRFNIAQLVRMARLLNGGSAATPLQRAAADLTGNGETDIADLVILARYVRGGRPPEPEQPYPVPDPAAKPKTLVVYYSATGTAARVARMVAQATGADLMELEPVEPYTAADLRYSDPDSRVSREHADPALRDVPLRRYVPSDFEAYDTIFLGYPIWWGIAAWPVDGFLTANDLTGKDVWCFCTSASSGAGQSAALLEQLAGTGTWLGVRRFSGGATQTEVDAWIRSISEGAAG